jgi:transcriptional regulator with PAS, ATPase and Fis domain
MVGSGSFRSDLYYRINQFPIVIPPLRERGEDIVLIALLLLNKYKNECPGAEPTGFHPETIRYIRNHSWPGNIRELSNVIRRAVLIGAGPLVRFEGAARAAPEPSDFDSACRRFQKSLLEKAIEEAGGNKELAARNLGLSRSTFYRYSAQLGI